MVWKSNDISMNCPSCKNPIQDNTTECEWCGRKLSNNVAIIDSTSDVDMVLLEMLKQGTLLNAVKYKKDNSNLDLRGSKEYVDELGLKHGLTLKKEGCFIATACYGNYESDEVIEFRKFRDDVLLKFLLGRIFVFIYYFVSPVIVILICQSEFSKRIIRSLLLTPILNLIKKKSNEK
jgi:hypothetical protein